MTNLYIPEAVLAEKLEAGAVTDHILTVFLIFGEDFEMLRMVPAQA